MTSRFTVHAGDCRDVMRDYPADHFDSIVSDPPYGLSFMGKGWDRGVPGEEFWREALRVAKPGAHLLAFGGTRTFHRLTVAIEDAGWEVRDVVCWLYATGFPKSLDVSKAIDRAAGAEREVIGTRRQAPKFNTALSGLSNTGYNRRIEEGAAAEFSVTAPATAAAQQWAGWGTALKPAWEPVIVARKPLDGTVAANVTRYGTGALYIDGCRVGDATGRWPANVMHDGSEEVVAGFPADEGRYFYCSKASRADREEGCDHLPDHVSAAVELHGAGTKALNYAGAGAGGGRETVKNFHPTVKPTDLMRYLCRLVTPPDGLVLDPFCGSGSTGKGALLEGFRFVGIDLDPAHVAIAEARCQFAVDTVDAEVAAAEAPGAQLSLF